MGIPFVDRIVHGLFKTEIKKSSPTIEDVNLGVTLRPDKTEYDRVKEIGVYNKYDWLWFSEFSDIFRIILNTLRTHLFRNGFEIEEKYTTKCPECDKEYEEDVKNCEQCGNYVILPSEKQKELIEGVLKKANRNNQSFLDVIVSLSADLEKFDDSFLLFVNDYSFHKETKSKVGQELKELIRIDPVFIYLRQSRNFTYGQDEEGHNIYTCLIHRKKELKDNVCDECGREAFPIWYTYRGGKHDIHYTEDEILHTQKYTPSLSWGSPPIKAIIVKMRSLMGQDTFIDQTYSLLRPPSGLLAFYSANPAELNRLLANARQEHAKNPMYPLMLSLSTAAGLENKSSAEFINFMQSNSEMQFVEMRQEFRRLCLAAYGVTPLFSGDIQSSGGLSNESRQLQVLDDYIEFGQDVINKKILENIMDRLGITDWVIRLAPAIEKNKMEEIQLKTAKAQYAQLMQSLGYENELDEEGEFTFTKREEQFNQYNPLQNNNFTQNNQYDTPDTLSSLNQANKTEDMGKSKLTNLVKSDAEITKSVKIDISKESEEENKKKVEEFKQELKMLIDKAKKELNISGTPTREDARKIVERVAGYFDKKFYPVVQREIKNVIENELSNLEKQLNVNLVLGKAKDNLISAATDNIYTEDAVKDFNEKLFERLSDVVGDKDITLDNLVDELRETVNKRESDLVKIARTESTKAANGARKIAYESIMKPSDKWKWDIVQDSRTTDVCKKIARRTKNGVSYDKLIEIMRDESSKQFPDWVVDDNQPAAHYQCRGLVHLVQK